MKLSLSPDRRSDASSTFFFVNTLPDTGANKSIISSHVLSTFFWSYCTSSAPNFRIVTANEMELNCLGSVNLDIFYEGKRTRIHALVSDNLHEDFLVSWFDLQRMGVLSKEFPHLPVSAPSTFQVHSSSSEATDTFEGLVDEFQDVFKENPDCLTPMLTEANANSS